MVTKVMDMSVDELKTLIQETVGQALSELLRDSDEGLALREDFQTALYQSLEINKSGGETISAESVAIDICADTQYMRIVEKTVDNLSAGAASHTAHVTY